ncbi:hypothetical protein [Devosia sp. XK-2]|uniref:hypothetical protein n=1 Tax=Devosia sp. XK-2 TaxID=3126689 RepID=UPI0030D288CD
MSILSPKTVYAPGRFPPKAEIIQLLEQIAGGTAGIGDYRGAWSAAGEYVEKDFVRHAGNIWYALRDNTTVTPVEGDDWTLLLPGVTVADGAIDLLQMADAAKADFRRVGPGLSEPFRCVWRTETEVTFQHTANLAMCGHFHMGNWEKATATLFPTPTPLTNGGLTYATVGDGISTQGDLLYENWCSVNVWENLWFVADDGDAAGQYKFTPSLRVGSVAGSVVTLNACGENSHAMIGATPKTFQWANNALVGVRVLVVTETVESRENSWSGRTATITANTNGTITLDEIGGLSVGDYFILLPNTDHYVWLFDAYFEDNGINSPPAPMVSVRNIGSSGLGRRATYSSNVTVNYPSAGTALAAPGNRVPYAGNISPLARALIAQVSQTFNSSSTGDYAEYFDQDGANHIIAQTYHQKTQADISETHVASQLVMSGSYGPHVYVYNAGSNVANVSAHSMLTLGWIY